MMRTVISLIIVLLLGGCEAMLFFPDHKRYSSPEQFSIAYEEIRFLSVDGTALHGWWMRPSQPLSKGLMVVAHGNAQNISAHFESWVWLVESGYEVFIFDYRGYGESEGDAAIKAAIDDTAAALEYAQKHHEGALFACGQSLGGMLLINALHEGDFDRYRLAIIDSSYSDLEALGQTVLSRSYLTWLFQWLAYPLLTDRYNPVDKVADVTIPLLFVAGGADRKIPPNNSWQLFDAAKRPKEFWLVPAARHIELFKHPEMRERLLEYLEKRPGSDQPSALKIFDNLDKIQKKL
jgi:alpha-beta hydrolase superfamily lysophospholipase